MASGKKSVKNPENLHHNYTSMEVDIANNKKGYKADSTATFFAKA